MEVILCLDDRNGMLFNGRRQSRDRQVIGDILKTAGDRPLWIRPFSLPLFAGAEERVSVDPEPLARGGLCFVEDLPLKPWEGKIEKLTVYRWNKLYPGDFYLDLDLGQGWRKTASEEFPGHSHEKITKEVYLP